MSGATEFKAATATDSLAFLSADNLYHIENAIEAAAKLIRSSEAMWPMSSMADTATIDGAGGARKLPELGSCIVLAVRCRARRSCLATPPRSAAPAYRCIRSLPIHSSSSSTTRSGVSKTSPVQIESIAGNDRDNIIDGRGGNDQSTAAAETTPWTAARRYQHGRLRRVGPASDSIDLGRGNADGTAEIHDAHRSELTMTEYDTLRNFADVVGFDRAASRYPAMTPNVVAAATTASWDEKHRYADRRCRQ